jgi:hypothetical protein
MTGNPLPWIVLSAIVAVTLVLKGYVKFPSSRTASQPAVPPTNNPVSNVTYQSASPSEAFLLEKLDSHTLGVYFALASRREAEANLAHSIARKAGDDIGAMFTAPFSPPAPAGQTPSQAGVPPTP